MVEGVGIEGVRVAIWKQPSFVCVAEACVQ